MTIHTSRLFTAAIIFIIGSAIGSYAKDGELPKGVVLAKVVAVRDATQSYALYLPTVYTPAHKYPVLYCFDPGGRGALPVERFRSAAERYGYIIVGSNNSRNGPGVPLNDIIRSLWEDTHSRLSIDERRVYLTGFSGGSRVALSVGYTLKGAVAGVIACSGGFPSQIKPEAPLPFALFGTAGEEDFNNPEMQRLLRSLDGSATPHRLEVFAGEHEWPPAEVCADAVEWMEIQAMRSGLREKDETFLESLFRKDSTAARSAEEAGDYLRAYLSYAQLSRDFHGLLDTSGVEGKAEGLKATKEVREAIGRELRMEQEQGRREQELTALIKSLWQSGDSASASADLRSAIGVLRKEAKSERTSSSAILARRLISSLLVQTFEEGNAFLFKKEYAEAAAQFNISAELQPDNPRIFYHLARAYALGRDTKKALDALQTAADKGFDDSTALAADEFAAIRNEKRFREISDAVMKNGAAKNGNR
jgi:tetratricopeptide (TPR) repeat protein